MLRDITLGQYYPKDSVIHRLDPRVKITAVLVYIVMLFLVRDFTGYGVSLLAVIAVTAASGVPFRFILRGMRPIAVIILLTFILNLFLYPGTILLSLGPLHITEQGLHQALFMVCRLVLLIFGTALLTYTTKPMKLTDGMESLMSPLSRFGFPSHEIAIIMSIALRFIPMLVQEADKIMKAQQARGADFRERQYRPEGKEPDAPLYSPVCGSLPHRSGSGDGDGSQMLPWRFRPYETSYHETGKKRWCSHSPSLCLCCCNPGGTRSVRNVFLTGRAPGKRNRRGTRTGSAAGTGSGRLYGCGDTSSEKKDR